MLDILSHTPVWVWGILVALVLAGRAMSRDREVRLPVLFIAPAVLFLLAIQGIVARFGPIPALGLWGGAVVVGAVLGQATLASSHVLRSRGGLLLKGSYVPMALMLSVFMMKYVVEALYAMYPVPMKGPLAIAVIPVLYGLLNGVFVGRVLRAAWLYTRTSALDGAKLA